MNHPIRITIENGYYAVRMPYNEHLINEIKKLPKALRSWDGNGRAWIVSPKAVDLLTAAIKRAGFELPEIPAMETAAISATVQKVLTVEYIGQCKDRGQKIVTALGSVHGFWSVEFPEDVLKAWFQRRLLNDNVQTFYQVLCVFETATDAEVKSAHRRLARQWHPDVCAEPEAAEKFRELTDAYEILRDPMKRRRYDAGLFFEREAKKKSEPAGERDMYGRRRKFDNQHFRSPLRCGLITAEGMPQHRFVVSRIISWDDITVDAGRIMTASWNKNLGPMDYSTGRPKGAIEIKWI